MIREKRLPTIAVLVLLLIGVAVGVYLVQSQTFQGARANPNIQPLQVEVSNVTHNSFTVSWVTQGAASGVVAYGEDAEAQFLARDKRDIFDQQINKYTTHWAQVVGLTPGRQYFFYIRSDNQQYDDAGKPYAVTTASEAMSPSSSGKTAYGTVKGATGEVIEGAVVLVKADGVAPLSTLSDVQGKWSINLAGARSSDVNSPAQVSDATVVNVRVQGGSGGNTTARMSYGQLSPVADLQLGKTYDFLSLQPTPSGAGGSQKSQLGLIPQLGATQNQAPTDVTIWNPQENEALATNQPLFIGQAPSGVVLTLTIDAAPNQITGTTTVDERGNWQWASPQNLTAGEHTVTAKYTNPQGVAFQQSRVFSVLTGDTSMPAIESTPSATITTAQASPTPTRITTSPTVAATRTPTPTVRLSGTATPTVKVSTTPAAGTPTPTTMAGEVSGTATPTRTPTPTTDSEISATPTPNLPVSGGTLPTLGLAGLGALILFVGIALLL